VQEPSHAGRDIDNERVPEHWTVPRIANRMHRTVLGPLGFQRRGNTCFRSDGGLDRSLKFYGLPADPPKVQLLAIVHVAGLPERALSETRYDWPG
jgi:hypothetical protein